MIETRTPPEYRPLCAVEADAATFARTGYVFAALRRELDWHTTAALHADHQADTYAATACASHIRETVRRMLEEWTQPVDALEQLTSTLAARYLRVEGISEPLAVDADQLTYRADAAARVRLIIRNTATF